MMKTIRGILVGEICVDCVGVYLINMSSRYM